MLVFSLCCKLSIVLCSLFILVLFSLPPFFCSYGFFLFLIPFFPSSFPSLFLSFLCSLLFGTYFFVFCVLLLHLVTICSFLHTLPCYCLLHLSHSTLLLFVTSFMFHPNTTRCFPHALPCYYLLLHPSLVATYSFVLHFLLPIPSFALHPMIMNSFLCASPYSYFFSPSHFTLLPTYSLLHVSPYYCLLPPLRFTLLLHAPFFVLYPTTICFFPLCFTLQLPAFSFVFHFATYLFFRTSSCCFYHRCQCYEVQSFKCSSMIYIINLYLTFNLISIHS
jgi:hypothetical protein